MEMADSIIITKADGDNIKPANLAKVQFKNALHLFPPAESGWIPQVETVSALNNSGIEKVWEIISSFENQAKINGHFESKRRHQQVFWMNETIREKLLNAFYHTPGLEELLYKVSQQLESGEITSYQAASIVLNYYSNQK